MSTTARHSGSGSTGSTGGTGSTGSASRSPASAAGRTSRSGGSGGIGGKDDATPSPAQEAPPWITRQLQTLLPQRGHALLLAGPSGLGQYELALALARAWLCDQPTEQGACGQCASCHAIDVRTHAELLVLLPEVLVELAMLK